MLLYRRMPLSTDQISLIVQLAGFALAGLLGYRIPRAPTWTLAVLCGFVISAIIGYFVIGGGGEGGLFALVGFPLVAAGLAKFGRAIRRD